MVVYACNPSTLGGWGRWITWVHEFETRLGNIIKPCLYKNNTEILGQTWWLMPLIPALWEGEVGRSLEVRRSRLSWPTWWNPISTKNTKISWVWWQVPVIPATREAEAEELLEPESQRLQWAEIAPLHSSLERARLHQLWEAEAGGSWGQEIETILVNMVKPHLY